MNAKIANKFMTKEMIGYGSFGSIYSGINIYNNDQVAIKFETSVNMKQKLFRESRIYQIISGAPGFPTLKHYGTEGDTAAMIIDLLGQNISALFEARHRSFSLKTVLMIADQTLTRIEYLHKKSIIHRDIKPENMAIGNGKHRNTIYLIDFGLAKSYCDMKTHQHNEFKTVPFLVGTPLYASINAMKNQEQSRRDDLESLAYVLLYLLRGNLPWEKTHSGNLKEAQENILRIKEQVTIEDLCRGLPEEFAILLSSVRQLEFDEEPKYSEYRRMFMQLFQRNNFHYDYQYDWEEKVSDFFIDKSDEHIIEKRKTTRAELLKKRVPSIHSMVPSSPPKESKFDFTTLARKKRMASLKVFT
ncbi:Casein kinase I isoform epsilon [Tritrichomonas foetus]|uniref:Casein kinase I isoform epsilon n=1 Tax=Tritrichomonas foetus TaxID=1144522 RepID=A0A1J4KX02_9EUKA|nr:Casein kinase I isoform epsilon [Tritrichomonas foetus]|eukprot:OHT15779.1 Casein kinase I isoform epsilon [Tritrichomonas foetus]